MSLLHLAAALRRRLQPATPLRDEEVSELRALGGRALATGDVPVAAIVLDGDVVIGRGFNTVVGQGAAGGHAEINALSDAITTVGPDAFARLDRARLRVVSTFAPCPMCCGALAIHRVRHVEFLMAKPLWMSLSEVLAVSRLDLRMRRREPASLQEDLFRAHPDYDPTWRAGRRSRR